MDIEKYTIRIPYISLIQSRIFVCFKYVKFTTVRTRIAIILDIREVLFATYNPFDQITGDLQYSIDKNQHNCLFLKLIFKRY